MLKSWSIKNFKPIVDSGELQMAPVTILAGRNSSGKSSLLQSILMIAQTLGSRLLDRPLLLNERFVQLGTFDDILSEKASSRNIDINLELWLGEETHSWTTTYSTAINVSFVSNNNADRSALVASNIFINGIMLNITFNAYQLAFNFEDPDNPRKENIAINFQAKRLKPDEKQKFLENVGENFYGLLSDANNYLGYLNYNQSSTIENPYLIGFSHFLPDQFIAKYNVLEEHKIAIEQELSELFQIGRRSNFRTSNTIEISLENISDDLFEEIAAFCQRMDILKVFTGETLGDLASWYKSLQWISESERIAFGQELQEIVMPYLLSDFYEVDNNLTEYSEGLEERVPLSLFARNIEEITHFFTNSIRYLGPLRSDPGTVQQQFAPTGELDHVGIKGEYAAIVYHTSKNTRIEWYNPQKLQNETTTLQIALDVWAQYLKIAEHISTEEAGAIGVTWQITPRSGQKPRLLPQVGVGISQILPILVMGLLSPANSLLIIEQPELHLHPFVQARLGDFFMGLAKCKKQCIIETHSENLVSQLRLHIVQAGGLEKSDCMVYFVDQDERGAAKFEKIDISPNGNILNWPDGFFDETMLQEDRITAASLRKRAQKAKHGS